MIDEELFKVLKYIKKHTKDFLYVTKIILYKQFWDIYISTQYWSFA